MTTDNKEMNWKEPHEFDALTRNECVCGLPKDSPLHIQDNKEKCCEKCDKIESHSYGGKMGEWHVCKYPAGSKFGECPCHTDTYRVGGASDRTFEEKKCCGGLGFMGKCGRGTKKGCNGLHCRCMDKDCANMHYTDCFEHYIHMEHVPKAEVGEWEKEFDKRFVAYMGHGLDDSVHPDELKAFITTELQRAYEEGFDKGGNTVGGTGRVMYQRGFEEGEKAMKHRIGDLNDYWKRGFEEGKQAMREELREKVEGIRRDFIARCEDPDTTVDATLVEETVYHIDHVLALLDTPNKLEIEVVEAPGDLCGNTKKLPDGSRCPGCRACC